MHLHIFITYFTCQRRKSNKCMERRNEDKEEEALPLTNEDIRRLVQEYCREEQCIREAKMEIRRDVILQYRVPQN